MGASKIDREGIPGRIMIIASELNTTIPELARRLDMKDADVYNYKYSKALPNLEFVVEITKLGFNPVWFLTGEGNKYFIPNEYPVIKASAGNFHDNKEEYLPNNRLQIENELLKDLIVKMKK